MGGPMNLLYYVVGSFMIISISGCFNEYPNNVHVSHIGRSVNGLYPKLKYRNEGVIVHNCRNVLSSNRFNDFMNSHDHKYDYANKGSYSSYCYTVKPGDTLFYIAWITGNNYHVLAEMNSIKVNDILKVGQILQVGDDQKIFRNKFLKSNINVKDGNIKKEINTLPALQKTLKYKHITTSSIWDTGNEKVCCSENKNFVNCSGFQKDIPIVYMPHNRISLNKNKKVVAGVPVVEKQSLISWSWPIIHGKVINGFSFSEGGNKGIDISGVLGQPVLAASQGKVVYAGDALLGYGNLIIIKHNDDFLSTYAHNDRILVVEQQNVKIGQKIATMGSSGSDVIKLHFEIRYQGRSVDPLNYLPKK